MFPSAAAPCRASTAPLRRSRSPRAPTRGNRCSRAASAAGGWRSIPRWSAVLGTPCPESGSASPRGGGRHAGHAEETHMPFRSERKPVIWAFSVSRPPGRRERRAAVRETRRGARVRQELRGRARAVARAHRGGRAGRRVRRRRLQRRVPARARRACRSRWWTPPRPTRCRRSPRAEALGHRDRRRELPAASLPGPRAAGRTSRGSRSSSAPTSPRRRPGPPSRSSRRRASRWSWAPGPACDIAERAGLRSVLLYSTSASARPSSARWRWRGRARGADRREQNRERSSITSTRPSWPSTRRADRAREPRLRAAARRDRRGAPGRSRSRPSRRS